VPAAEQAVPDTGRCPSEGYDRQPLAWIGDHIRPASDHVPHIGSLEPQAGEPKLTETSYNAFTTTSPIAQRDAPTGQTVEQLRADPRTLPASMPGEMARGPLTPQEAQVARLAREGPSNRKSPRACSSPRTPSRTT